MRYQGFTNYETWVVWNWLSNDQGSHYYWTERAREIFSQHPEDALHKLADELMYSLDQDAEQFIGDQTNMFTDLLNGAFAQVDWRDISDSYISTAQDNAA